MAQSMQATKRRIKSISATKKITNAMELVATSKLKRSKDTLQGVKGYTDEILNMVSTILSKKIDTDSPYLTNKEGLGTLYIVTTSTLGLCGGYNSNALKEFMKVFDKDKDQLIVLGQKGTSYFTHRNIKILASFNEDSTGKEYSLSKQVSNLCLKMYSEQKISKVSLVYTRFVNSVVFDPCIIDLLPVNKSDFKELKQTATSKDTLFEPNANEIINKLIPMYFEATIYGRLVESHVSEQASRRMAMENATDNASDLIDKLQLQYNKARQSAITQQISEVVGGANAL